MDSTVTDGRRQLLQDLLITGLALWYLTSWLLCGCGPEGRRVILSIVASLCLYAGEYLSAHYRVPCRIYPMVRLARLYIAQGMDAEALAQARHAADMPVNQRLRSMQKLHDEAVTMRDSLAVIPQ